MTSVSFTRLDGSIIAFSFRGHSGFSTGKDIVCAAVSSAAYLTANTLTDVMNINADVALDEKAPELTVSLTEADAAKAQEMLIGLLNHIQALQKQYPRNLKCELFDL